MFRRILTNYLEKFTDSVGLGLNLSKLKEFLFHH